MVELRNAMNRAMFSVAPSQAGDDQTRADDRDPGRGCQAVAVARTAARRQRQADKDATRAPIAPRQTTNGSGSIPRPRRLPRDVAECSEKRRRAPATRTDPESVLAQCAESVTAFAVAGSCRSPRRTRCVNGMRISRKTSIETRKPGR